MKKEEIKELNFFRGIAALFIVLYHYTTRYGNHIKQPYYIDIKYGYMAVAIFFILSGFLITLKIHKEKPKDFFIKRMIRIYPTYFFAMVLTTFVMIICGDEFKSRVCSIKEWLINLTMFPAYFGARPVDGVYWTLSREVIFYGIIWTILLLKKQNKMEFISLIWIILSILINILLRITDNFILKLISIIGITDFSQLFITGIIMSLTLNKKNTNISYIIIGLCIINQLLYLGIAYTIFLIFFDLIFYFIVVLKKITIKNIRLRFIEFIAKISYPLYLTHQFIGYAIINKIEKMGLINEIYLIIPITIAIFIAYIIHITIEQPTYKILSNKFLKSK